MQLSFIKTMTAAERLSMKSSLENTRYDDF